MPVVWSKDQVLGGQIRWSLEFFLLVSLLLWSEREAEGRAIVPLNKIASCCLDLVSSGGADRHPLAGHGGEGRMQAVVLLLDVGDGLGDVQMPLLGARLPPLAGRGGEERRSFSFLCCGSGSCWRDVADVVSLAGDISMVEPSIISAEGQPPAISGSYPSAALAFQLSNLKADGQPLPPCLPFNRRKVIYLQASKPMRRPSGAKTACSRCFTPSGVVPGGEAVGRAWSRRCHGGDGAGRRPVLDCFSIFRFRVCFVICQDLVVMFTHSEVLHVKCTPPTLL